MSAHTALRRQHVRRKLQIHDPRHVGSALGSASPAAPADVVPGAEHAVRVLRSRADEQLHREFVRGRGARTRRGARDGHSQLEARDQSGRGGGRVAQGTVPSPWAVDPLGGLDGRGYDGRARWGRACAASEREGAFFFRLSWMMSLAADSPLLSFFSLWLFWGGSGRTSWRGGAHRIISISTHYNDVYNFLLSRVLSACHCMCSRSVIISSRHSDLRAGGWLGSHVKPSTRLPGYSCFP